MNTLFGLSMDTIMAWMLALFAIVTLAVGITALLHPLLFRMALRNVPRRRSQSILIVIGLMLSTLIITSAFGTGDTISYSVRSTATSNLGNVDETVTRVAGVSSQTAGGSTFMSEATVGQVQAALAGNGDVGGVMGITAVGASLQDLTTGQTKNRAMLLGLPASSPAAFGALSTSGNGTVRMAQLAAPQPAPGVDATAVQAGEAYINQQAADALNARPGDTLHLFVANRLAAVRVRAVVRNENMAAGGLLSQGTQSDPTVLMPLDRVERLIGQPGQVTAVAIANLGDLSGRAAHSAGVTDAVRAVFADQGSVLTAKLLLASPAGKAALISLTADPAHAGVKDKLTELQQQVAAPGASPRLKCLLSDPAVADALKTITSPSMAATLNDALASISDYSVSPLTKTALDYADIIGNVVTSIFVVFGLFSVAAGVMLIFLIFVMLAAERRAEMGMARAIGTKRRHLIQQFLFEGYTYDLFAAIVGVVLGILVSLGLAQVMAALFASSFAIHGHVEPRSLVVSFCLGALVTFATVAFSSWRVSRLNIVAAIRDLPDEGGRDGSVAAAFSRPLHDLATAGRRLRRRHVRGALGSVYAALWHAITGWGVFFRRGVLLLPIGAFLLANGLGEKSAVLYTTGVSLLIIGVAMTLRWILGAFGVRDAVRNRIGYTLGGLGLVTFWLLPEGSLSGMGVPKMSSGMEMFFVSGMMLVIGGVWAVMYNADLILAGLMRVFGRSGTLAPVLKTAVSYPMQYKFRTGVTLAMFSLVIFTLIVMSVLIGSMAGSLDVNRDAGGWQIFGAVNPDNPIVQIDKTLSANPALRGVTAYGGLARTYVSLRQPGRSDQRWQPYVANIADNAYLNGERWTLHARAAGYSSDRQVWQTLQTKPGYAVVDDTLVPRTANYNVGGRPTFTIAGFHYEDKTFVPPVIEMRDGRSGAVMRLTVLGVLDTRAQYVPALTSGVYTGEPTLAAAGLPPILPNTYVFRTAPGQDVHTLALALGQAFLGNGLDVKEVQHEYDSYQALNTGLNSLLQAFMGLGLVVGIAALGVIAFRSVVERRQQIGVLRAIGFKRSMIRNSFLLESSFVALLGTLLGVVLGLALSRNLVDSVAKDNPGITLSVSWLQIVLIVAVAYLASLLTTWLPAWQASRVYPADVLRYE